MPINMQAVGWSLYQIIYIQNGYISIEIYLTVIKIFLVRDYRCYWYIRSWDAVKQFLKTKKTEQFFYLNYFEIITPILNGTRFREIKSLFFLLKL